MISENQNQENCDSNVPKGINNESNFSDTLVKQCFSTTTSSTGCVGVDSGNMATN
jgi:hypothetical protein